MKREYAYIAIVIVLALFLVALSLSKPGELTGRIVDGNLTNETTNETLINQTQETTNETTNETAINQTSETTNQTTETNQTTNQTQETTNETTNETVINQTTDQQTDTTTTTTQQDQTQADTSQITGTTVEEETQEEATTQTEQTPVNQTNQTAETSPAESQIDRILRELEEQGILEGSQPQEPEQEEVSSITGGVVETGNETCLGCLLNDKCYEFNERKQGKYCLSDKAWTVQKAFNETCSNNFECRSNLCVESQCTKPNIISFIVDWFRKLFRLG